MFIIPGNSVTRHSALTLVRSEAVKYEEYLQFHHQPLRAGYAIFKNPKVLFPQCWSMNERISNPEA
jgi:hypothetical protein